MTISELSKKKFVEISSFSALKKINKKKKKNSKCLGGGIGANSC
jgi:hypothetical protein